MRWVGVEPVLLFLVGMTSCQTSTGSLTGSANRSMKRSGRGIVGNSSFEVLEEQRK